MGSEKIAESHIYDNLPQPTASSTAFVRRPGLAVIEPLRRASWLGRRALWRVAGIVTATLGLPRGFRRQHRLDGLWIARREERIDLPVT